MQCSSVGCSLDQWKDIRPWRPSLYIILFVQGGSPTPHPFSSRPHFVWRPSLGLKGSILFSIFGGAAKLRWGGAQRPVWRVYEHKKTGARSARARTRGQNPLVKIYLPRILCLSFVLSYSCRPVILSYLRNAELFFMFKNSN